MKFSVTTITVVVLALALLAEDSYAQGKKGGKRRRNNKGNSKIRRNRPRNRPRPIHPLPVPAPQPCPPIPHIDNGQGLDTGNTVQYACEPGYVLEGTNVITCLNGRWTVAPRCRRQLCPLPPNVPFAVAPQLSNGGVTASYTCNSGYRIVGGNGATTSTIHCNTQSQFWPNLPACEQIPDIRCHGPPSIHHAISTVAGSIATYTCITGYKLKSGTPARITCLHGSWPSIHLPMCESDPNERPAPVKCLKSPPCGGKNINREEVGDAYAVKASVKFTCDTGYRIVGSDDNKNNSASVYCKDDGTWTVTPTCEPVVCGVPPIGTNTKPVVATTISYPGTYTYVCIDNYETGSSLESKCLADGNWSLKPAPTCTQKTCKKSALPALPNANFAPQDVPVGGTVDYTCSIAFRLAPATPTSTNRVQTTTCQADGTFTALASTCVYTYPESCRDYFTRDNLFAAATPPNCVTITIDPQGPGLELGNPPAAQVQCCKDSATTICTRVTPDAERTGNIGGNPCIGSAVTDVLPTTIFETIAINAHCGTGKMVGYPISDEQILSMIKSTSGTCRQITTTTCTAGLANAIALRLNGDASGYLYGTNVFTILPPVAVPADDHIDLNHYTYTGQACDCADSLVNPLLPPTPTCVGGCRCTQLTAAGTSDTITKYLTADNPQYVTHYQFARFAIDLLGGTTTPGPAELAVTVGDIECCETF